MFSLKCVTDIFKPKVVEVDDPEIEIREFQFPHSSSRRVVISIQDASVTIRYLSLLGFRYTSRATYLAVVKLVEINANGEDTDLKTSYEMGFYDNLPKDVELPLYLHGHFVLDELEHSNAVNHR